MALEVAPGAVPAALDGVRALGMAGLSVTMPHKEAAAAAVDVLTDDARGPRRGELRRATTTASWSATTPTAPGFLAALRSRARRVGPTGCRCVRAGAGGAARSIALALARGGAAQVAVVNRTAERAEKAAALAGSAGGWSTRPTPEMPSARPTWW